MRRLIFVVDHDFDIRAVLRDRLEAFGFDVLTASNSHHALTLMVSQAVRGISVGGALLDLEMPGSDCMSVLQEMRERHQQLPVIMMSSQVNIDKLKRAVQDGATDFLLKPIDYDLLSEKCDRYFRGGKRESK